MASTESVRRCYAFVLVSLCFVTEDDSPEDVKFRCGGVLVAPRSVLTAAHCVEGLRIFGGVHPLLFPDERTPNSVITIAIYDDGSSSIFYHPPNISKLQLDAQKSAASTTEAVETTEATTIEGAASRFSAPGLAFASSESALSSASRNADAVNSFIFPSTEILPRSTTTVPKLVNTYLKLGQATREQQVRPSTEVSKTSERVYFNNTEEAKALGVDGHPAWSTLSAAECGESFSDRIIGGVDAMLGQYPWLARIGYAEDDSPEDVKFRCGGVLVAPRSVLTAAHCVEGLRIARVRLGEHDIRSHEDCDDSMCAEPVQDFVPIRSHVHENFNEPRYANDVAIIELDRDADYNGWVAPICLPRGSTLTSTFTGSTAHAAGWGVIDMNTQASARILQTVRLPVLARARCVHSYRRKATISEEQICAGAQPDKDACSGDSGGPLMKVLSEDDTPRYFLLGVVSFGPRICGTKQPGVYANVSHHMPWILDHIKLDYE